MGSANGILSLEAEWTSSPDRDYGIRPVLRFVTNAADRPGRVVHRQLSVESEVEKHLRWWRQRSQRRFPILYLSGHGSAGKLYLSAKRNAIDLTWLATLLEGKCKGRYIHFGSCSTFRLREPRLLEFVERTGAIGISGFTREIDWAASAIFDVMLLTELQDRALSKRTVELANRRVWNRASGLAKALGFRMVTAP